jgi:tRNA pseudouridine13 synthase
VKPVPDLAAGFVHAVYRLEKTSLSTPEAVGLLAGALKIKAGGISHAGLKDKHAQTVQHVSVEAGKGKDPESLPEVVSGQRWEARRLGWLDMPLDAGAIASNHFALVVRGLSRDECKAMDARAASLAKAGGWDGDGPPSLPIANYFGDQRFGSARHGEGFAGRCLVRGDFEGALKLLIGTPARKDTGARREMTRLLAQSWGEWSHVVKRCPKSPERAAIETLAEGGSFKDAFASLPNLLQQMAVEAYQSFLWNAALRRLVMDVSGAGAGNALTADDEYGVMSFPATGAGVSLLRGVEMPMPAAEMELSGIWARAMRETLVEEKVKIEDLRIPGLRRPAFGSALRPVLVDAAQLAIGPAERDDLAAPQSTKPWKKLVEFDLPRGAYATVVMRALGQ